jgi:hypothetical protein
MLTLCLLTNLVLNYAELRGGLLRGVFLGTAVVAVLVVSEEISQIWIPSRSFDPLDLSADAIGILVGDLTARRIRCRTSTRSAGLADQAEPRDDCGQLGRVDAGESEEHAAIA